MSRFVLGTVQFGQPYGIANRVGQVGYGEAESILRHAWGAGIDTLDTAIAYGDSERRLGEIGVRQWGVISKLPPVAEDCSDVAAWMDESVRCSLQRLAVPKLHGLLLHRSQELLGPHAEELYRGLLSLRDRGKIGKIGVSIYDPEELGALLPRFDFDIVQAPFSIVDRRLAHTGWMARLHDQGAEIHVRSVFLQGLLLMPKGTRPAKFDRWRSLWNEWDHWSTTEGSPLRACLRFVLSEPSIDRIVVGVDSLAQLQEILATSRTDAVVSPPELACDDLDLVNPSRWGTL